MAVTIRATVREVDGVEVMACLLGLSLPQNTPTRAALRTRASARILAEAMADVLESTPRGAPLWLAQTEGDSDEKVMMAKAAERAVGYLE